MESYNRTADQQAPVSYQNYICLDTLLDLQRPITRYSDEQVFITYHQIVELYYSLILKEIEQIHECRGGLDASVFVVRLQRISRYFRHIVNSFDIITDGLDTEEFLAFRAEVGSTSGFQSVQHRLIEFAATDLELLADVDAVKCEEGEQTLESAYQRLYWRKVSKHGSSEAAELMLSQFEDAYRSELMNYAERMQGGSLRSLYSKYFAGDPTVIHELKEMDRLMNYEWKKAHLKAALKHLNGAKKIERGTGGSDWRKYLTSSRAHVMFFPELWSQSELDELFQSAALDG